LTFACRAMSDHSLRFLALVLAGDAKTWYSTSAKKISFGKYPGYTGDLSVVGTATVEASDASGLVVLSWALKGLEGDKCAPPPEGIANACGIHIHVGMTCDDAASVGDHYYDMDSMEDDPWAPFVYTPTKKGESKFSKALLIGKNFPEVLGRSVVVHDSTGGRVACGLIPSDVDLFLATLEASDAPGLVVLSWEARHLAIPSDVVIVV